MTVIAAIARDGQVVMAADVGVSDDDLRSQAAPKIRRVHCSNGGPEMLLGASGAARILPMFVRAAKIPTPIRGRDLDDWAQEISELLGEVMADAKPPVLVDTSSAENPPDVGGVLLLGFRGQLWTIDTGYACPVPDGIFAIGSGNKVALGAMHALAGQPELSPTQVLTRAIEITCRFMTTCWVDVDGPQIELLDP